MTKLVLKNVYGESELIRLVERGWLEEEEALSLAANWLFNNPNRFFKLGFEEVRVA